MALTDDEGYYCFGYANKSVKNEFKYYFRNFSTLAAAIDSLIFLGDDNLYSRYTFIGNDVKYKLRAKASSQDDPVKVNEALLRWYSFVERSNYKSMGCVIEKILMVRKEILSKQYYQACEELKDFKELAEISYNRDIIDNDGNLQTNTKLSNLNHDENVWQNGNSLDMKSSDPLAHQGLKEEITSSINLSERSQNFNSDESAEYEPEPSTEDGKKCALDNNLKSKMVEKNTKNTNDEAVLNIEKDDPADVSGNFAEKSKLELSKDFHLTHILPNFTEVLDNSELVSQQLKRINLVNDVQLGKNIMPTIQPASEHVPKELPTCTESDELEKRKNSEDIDDACEESDSWGTTIEISSDYDSACDYEHYDNQN